MTHENTNQDRPETNLNRDQADKADKRRTLGETRKMMDTRTVAENRKGMREKIVDGVAKISSKGQVVIPVDIRSAMGIKEGDQLHFVLENDRLVIEPVHLLSAEELFGLFDEPSDNNNFVLDLQATREERAEDILKHNWLKDEGLEKGE